MTSTAELRMRGVTRKEAEVLDALRERLTNVEIAARLYVSKRTVESHVSSLMRKLGVSSRRELAALAASIEEPPPDAPPALPPILELAAESSPLIGRELELERLRALHRRSAAGQTLMALVTGEAGIGKSRLVAELAKEIHGTGGSVLMGSCSEETQAPYEPFVHALADDLERLTEPEIKRRVAHDARALRRLLPSLPTPTPTTPTAMPTGSPDVIDAPTERADVVAAVHHYLARGAEIRPTVLILEDLHWATATTGDVVRHLARSPGAVPLLVVATSRDVRPDLTDEVSALIGDLERCPSVHRIRLGGLGPSDVRYLLEWLAAQRTGIDAEALHAETGGNPLFVREAADTQLSPGSAAGPLRGLLARRYRRLDDADLAVLDLAAVIGVEFDADLLAAATGATLLDILDVLERTEAAGLTTAAPGRPGRFSFAHGLFRASRYEDLSAGRRMRLHLQVAEALAARPGGADRFASELARHACAAAPLGDVGAAARYAVRAGDKAAHSLAFHEAGDHYRQALVTADLLDPPDETVRAQILVRLGETLHYAGDPSARSVLEQAAAAARQLADGQLLAATAWAMTTFGQTVVGVFDEAIVGLADDALGLLSSEPTAARARVLAVLAAEYGGSVVHAHRRHDLAREALTVAREVDDPVTLGHVLVVNQWAAWDPDNVEARLAVADELVELGERRGLAVLSAFGYAGRTWTHIELGNLAAAWDAGDAYEAAVGASHMALHALGLGVLQTTRHYLAGELADAERSAESHVTLAAAAGLEPLDYYSPHLITIRFAQGRLAELEGLIEAAAAANPDAVAYRTVLALARARAGRREEAGEILSAFCADRFALLPRDFFWYAGLVALADVADHTGDAAAAAALAEQLSPYSGRLAVYGIGVSHPIDLALAQLALTLGDVERASEAAAAATEAARQNDTPVFLARALLLQAAARPGDHSVGALVEEALDIAAAIGAGLVAQDAARYQLV